MINEEIVSRVITRRLEIIKFFETIKENQRNLTTIFDKFCYNNTNHILYLDKSKIRGAGLGIYTAKKIKKGEFIGYYEGELIYTKNPYKADYGDYSFSINNNYYINSEKYPRCYIAMINDSHGSKFNNNCEFEIEVRVNGKLLHPKKRRICLKAIKDIKPGEEMLASYGDDYWEYR